MPQHLAYIDPDEEIISVISRLRKAAETDVFFAVPKRALFLQSLVNLRLLERESKKLGKRLCLVTQDDAGRSLAEKAGILTKSSLEGVEGAGPRVAGASLPARLSHVDRADPSESHGTPSNAGSVAPLHSESIGSSSFFAEKESAVDFPVGRDREVALPRYTPSLNLNDESSRPPFAASPSVPRSVPVRDRTPKQLTALNSARGGAPMESAPSRPVSPLLSFPAPDAMFSPSAPQSSLVSQNAESVATPLSPLNVAPAPAVPDSSRETSLARFYQNQKNIQTVQGNRASALKTPSVSGNAGQPVFRRILFGFIAVSLLAAIGVSVVIFVPRADVTVLVKQLSESADMEATAKANQQSVDVDGKMIPLRLIEVEKDVAQSFPSTGQSSVSDKRARGTVTISNAFSASPQPLVATTRLESSDGKIFRLVKGVMVPGMKTEGGKAVPGTIDTEVTADASGDGSDIAPTSFTIPGLKGSPKYDKISARSSAAFVGGGTGSGAIASVSADDVVRAKDAMLKKLPDLLRTELEKDLQPGEKLLDDAILSETLSSGAFPGAGAVASSFDYRVHVSVRAMVFSEADVRDVAVALLGNGARSEDVVLEYTVPRPDFTAKSMIVKAHVSVSKNPMLDIESVKKSILGKSVGDVQTIFADYPDIQKIEVVFWPKFMTSRIPGRASQVSVHVETASEK